MYGRKLHVHISFNIKYICPKLGFYTLLKNDSLATNFNMSLTNHLIDICASPVATTLSPFKSNLEYADLLNECSDLFIKASYSTYYTSPIELDKSKLSNI